MSDRFFGSYKALDERGKTLSQAHRLHLNVEDLDDIRTKLAGALSTSDRPTAIFFVDDYLAARSVGVLNEMGVRVPDDMSVIPDLELYCEIRRIGEPVGPANPLVPYFLQVVESAVPPPAGSRPVAHQPSPRHISDNDNPRVVSVESAAT